MDDWLTATRVEPESLAARGVDPFLPGASWQQQGEQAEAQENGRQRELNVDDKPNNRKKPRKPLRELHEATRPNWTKPFNEEEWRKDEAEARKRELPFQLPDSGPDL